MADSIVGGQRNETSVWSSQTYISACYASARKEKAVQGFMCTHIPSARSLIPYTQVCA